MVFPKKNYYCNNALEKYESIFCSTDSDIVFNIVAEVL